MFSHQQYLSLKFWLLRFPIFGVPFVFFEISITCNELTQYFGLDLHISYRSFRGIVVWRYILVIEKGQDTVSIFYQPLIQGLLFRMKGGKINS
jgi:hypothetical protein